MPRSPDDVRDLAELCGLIVWPSFIERLCDTRAEKFYNGGWRGTKTVTGDQDALNYIVELLLRPGSHLGWIIGPDYEQARPDYANLADWCRDRLKMQVHTSDATIGPLTMTISQPGLPGTIEIATKSAGHPQTLGAVGPRFILACEAGQMSEDARDRIRGRASTHNAPIIWNGTFENNEGNAQYAWFEEESKRYMDNPTARRKSYSLPIWENMGLFADCREMIEEDPTLIAFCPDENHGRAHSGIDPNHPALIPTTSGVPLHPKVRELYEECRDKPTFWRKYYAGEAVGVLNPVYEWSQGDSLTNFANNVRLISMSEAQRRLGRPFRWLRSAGGMDFGTVHPSAITAGSINDLGDTWVRKSLKDSSGAIDWVWAMQTLFSREFHIPASMWGRDPMVKYTPSYVPGEAMSGSMFAREARVGVVNSIAQVKADAPTGHLYLDADDPGNVLLMAEIQRVHRKKLANGQVAYDRTEGEDMAASFEDMMAMLHGQPTVTLPKSVRMRVSRPGFSRQPSRVYQQARM